MKPGRYASDDGSFARSAGGAGARGLALLAIALLIGIVLLNATDADPPGATVSAQGDADTTDADSGGGGDAAGEDDGGGGGEAAAAPTSVPTTTTVPARAPKDVKVIIANASDVSGAAGNVKKVLDPAGYNVLAPSNATKVAESSVFHTAGFEADARAVATALGLPATVVKALPAPPPFDTKGANVAVVIGADSGTKFGAAPAAGTGTAGTGAGATATTTAGAGATGSGATGASTTTTTAVVTTTTKRP